MIELEGLSYILLSFSHKDECTCIRQFIAYDKLYKKYPRILYLLVCSGLANLLSIWGKNGVIQGTILLQSRE